MTNFYNVKFILQDVQVAFQRASIDDSDTDYAILAATSTADDASRFTSGRVQIGGGITSGAVLQNLSVETPILHVTDDDTIRVKCKMDNIGHSDAAKAIGDGLKIAAAILAVMAGGEKLASEIKGFKNIEFLGISPTELALDAGVIALAGDVIGDLSDLFGLSHPDCDGPVFDPESNGEVILMNVSEFVARFNSPLPPLNTPLGLSRQTDSSQVSQKGCGHNPETTARIQAVFTAAGPIPEFTQSLPVTHLKPAPAGTAAFAGTWVTRTSSRARVWSPACNHRSSSRTRARRVSSATTSPPPGRHPRLQRRRRPSEPRDPNSR